MSTVITIPALATLIYETMLKVFGAEPILGIVMLCFLGYFIIKSRMDRGAVVFFGFFGIQMLASMNLIPVFITYLVMAVGVVIMVMGFWKFVQGEQ